jgi:hypothetical protein
LEIIETCVDAKSEQFCALMPVGEGLQDGQVVLNLLRACAAGRVCCEGDAIPMERCLWKGDDWTGDDSVTIHPTSCLGALPGGQAKEIQKR